MKLLVTKQVTRTVIDQVATGKNVRALRESKGLSLRAVARATKTSPPALCDLEHGRRNWKAKCGKRVIEFLTKRKGAKDAEA